jgi:hypothetical protein
MNLAQNNTIPPECGPTLERIQSVLDRIHSASILAADPHLESCMACCERVSAARQVLTAFAEPKRVAASPNLTETILAGMKRDRIARARRRGLLMAGSFVAAVIGVIVLGALGQSNRFANRDVAEPESLPRVAAPAPHPLRVNDELAKAGEALRESSHAITDPAASAPRVLAALTDTLLKSPPARTAVDFGPAGKSLAEIPDAARAGLEPIAGTAQKAFNRLLHDVTALQPKVKS